MLYIIALILNQAASAASAVDLRPLSYRAETTITASRSQDNTRVELIATNLDKLREGVLEIPPQLETLQLPGGILARSDFFIPEIVAALNQIAEMHPKILKAPDLKPTQRKELLLLIAQEVTNAHTHILETNIANGIEVGEGAKPNAELIASLHRDANLLYLFAPQRWGFSAAIFYQKVDPNFANSSFYTTNPGATKQNPDLFVRSSARLGATGFYYDPAARHRKGRGSQFLEASAAVLARDAARDAALEPTRAEAAIPAKVVAPVAVILNAQDRELAAVAEKLSLMKETYRRIFSRSIELGDTPQGNAHRLIIRSIRTRIWRTVNLLLSQIKEDASILKSAHGLAALQEALDSPFSSDVSFAYFMENFFKPLLGILEIQRRHLRPAERAVLRETARNGLAHTRFTPNSQTAEETAASLTRKIIRAIDGQPSPAQAPQGAPAPAAAPEPQGRRNLTPTLKRGMTAAIKERAADQKEPRRIPPIDLLRPAEPPTLL